MPPLSPEDSLDVRRAAALVGRHPETVRRWVWSGRLPAQRRGNRLLVARADVEALAASDGGAVTSLTSWAAKARSFQASTASSGAGSSAADLVLEDRRLRSGIEDDDAGR